MLAPFFTCSIWRTALGYLLYVRVHVEGTKVNCEQSREEVCPTEIENKQG